MAVPREVVKLTNVTLGSVQSDLLRIKREAEKVKSLMAYALMNREGEITEGLVHQVQILLASIGQATSNMDTLVHTP